MTDSKQLENIIETIRKNYPNLHYESDDSIYIYEELLKICEKIGLKSKLEECYRKNWGIKYVIVAAFSKRIRFDNDLTSVTNLMKANLKEVSNETIEKMMALLEQSIPKIISGEITFKQSIYTNFTFCFQRLLSLIILKRVRNIPLEIVNEFVVERHVECPFVFHSSVKEQFTNNCKKLLEYLIQYDSKIYSLGDSLKNDIEQLTKIRKELSQAIFSDNSLEYIQKQTLKEYELIKFIRNNIEELRKITPLPQCLKNVLAAKTLNEILKNLEDIPHRYCLE